MGRKHRRHRKGFLLHSAKKNPESKMAAPVERLSPKHPDWLWLQSPMEQLMAERSAPFDAKVDCWIADPDEVYIRAKIVSAGDKCTVESPKGTTELPKAEVFECNPTCTPSLTEPCSSSRWRTNISLLSLLASPEPARLRTPRRCCSTLP